MTVGERVADDFEHLGRRHAPPVDEGCLDPAPLHLGGDLRAGAVHDDDVVPLRAERERGRRSLRRHPAAELEHDPAHVVYSALIRT